MKRWLKNCRILVMCLAAVLLLGTVCPVMAASADTPTLRIQLKNREYPVEFAIFRVADYADGNYNLLSGPNDYAAINDGISSEADKLDLNRIETTGQLLTYAKMLISWANVKGYRPDLMGTTQEGIVDFGTVEMGMYLVMQVARDDDRLEVSPFLVGVPYWETATIEGESETQKLVYNVVAKPKSEEIIPEPETETPPPETETPPPPEPETPPQPSEPDNPPPPSVPEPPEPEWVEEVPGVLGAMRGVLGAVRTGDLSSLMIAFYVAMMAAAAGSAAYVIARRRRNEK